MRILFIIAVIFLAGCSTFTDPPNEIRVTEYGAKGSYMADFTGRIGGVRIVTKGTVGGCLEYKGTKAKFTSKDCSK